MRLDKATPPTWRIQGWNHHNHIIHPVSREASTCCMVHGAKGVILWLEAFVDHFHLCSCDMLRHVATCCDMLRHGDGSTHTKLKAPKSKNSWIIKMNSTNASQLHLSLSFVDFLALSATSVPSAPTWSAGHLAKALRISDSRYEPMKSLWQKGSWAKLVNLRRHDVTWDIHISDFCHQKMLQYLQSMGSLQWFPNQDRGPCLGVQSWALPNRTM